MENSFDARNKMSSTMNSSEEPLSSSNSKQDMNFTHKNATGQSNAYWKKDKNSLQSEGTQAGSEIRSTAENVEISVPIPESEGDPRRQLTKLKQQFKQKDARIQALYDLFKVILEKMTETLEQNQVKSIIVDKQMLEENDAGGMGMVAQMFAGATGVNPEPLLTGIESMYYKILTLLKKQSKPAPPPQQPINIKPYEIKIEKLQTQINEKCIQIKEMYTQIKELQIRLTQAHILLGEKELMRKSLEQQISRLRSSKKQCELILHQSEKYKHELVMYHECRYNIIRQSYSSNNEVSGEVVVLLDKIQRLEKKLRQIQMEMERQRDQKTAEAQQILCFFEKFKQQAIKNRRIVENLEDLNIS